MSGRKQHYIPRYVLKGFASQTKLDQWQAQTYLKSGRAFVTNINNIAASRDFYSGPNDVVDVALADDAITQQEELLSAQWAQILSLPNNAAVDSTLAARHVGHLAFRTRPTREEANRAIASLANQFETVASSPPSFYRALGFDSPRLPSYAAKTLKTIYSENKNFLDARGIKKRKFEEAAIQYIKNKIETQAEGQNDPLWKLPKDFKSHMESHGRNIHSKALINQPAPPIWLERLARLNWTVHQVFTESVALPDTIAISQADNGEWLPLSLGLAAVPEFVVCLASSNQLLIGSRSTVLFPPNFNELVASCSSEFFLSRTYSAKLLAMTPEIGTSISLYISNALASAWKSLVE